MQKDAMKYIKIYKIQLEMFKKQLKPNSKN